MTGQRVVFRADGNAQIGLGHVSRSLALAEMLSPEFTCVFATVNPSESALSLIGTQFQVLLLTEGEGPASVANFARDVVRPTDIVVLDGYHFDLGYQKEIKAAGARLVCLDDLNAQPFVADAVINHAPGTNSGSYCIQPYTKLCLGFDFALLRPPFLRAAQEIASGNCRLKRDKNHLLITFGGADKYNLCEKIARMCLAYPEVEKISVVAGVGSNVKALRKLEKVAVISGLAAEEMCSLMLDCSVLVAPASTVVMEGLATALPVLCGYYVPEQLLPYQKLKETNCITPVGDCNTVTSQELRFALINRPEMPVSWIDGRQPERFRNLFRSLR